MPNLPKTHKLGSWAKDILSGVEGYLDARLHTRSGMEQYRIVTPVSKTKEKPEVHQVDASLIVVINNKDYPPIPYKETPWPDDIEFGAVVQDIYCSYKGIITEMQEWLAGCNQIAVISSDHKTEGVYPPEEAFNVNNVKVIEKTPKSKNVKKPTGGPAKRIAAISRH